jgi:hypothetical protein
LFPASDDEVEIARVLGCDVYFILCGEKTNSMFNLMEETALFQQAMLTHVDEFFIQLGTEDSKDRIVPTTSNSNAMYVQIVNPFLLSCC